MLVYTVIRLKVEKTEKMEQREAMPPSWYSIVGLSRRHNEDAVYRWTDWKIDANAFKAGARNVSVD